MFPLDALAVVVPGGGTNIGYAGGKTTKFRFREYVGIALGIQQMKGDEYRVGKPTEDEVKANKKGALGMARVVQHFLYSYPNPYSPSGGQGLFYIVPKAAGAPKYVAAVSSAGVGQAPIGSNWCYASSGAFSHTKSDELFKALTSKISDQNPNPSIDPNYFTVFEEVSCAGITESDRSFVSKYLRLFNTRVKDRMVFKGRFFSWPAPPTVIEMLPYLSESNMQRSLAVGVTLDGSLCFLTGEDIRRNALSSNALGLVYIYTECMDAVTRAKWDGTEVCAVPLAIDVVDHVKRCLGAVK